MATEPVADDDGYIDWLDNIWRTRLKTKWSKRPSLVVGILVCPGFPMLSLTGIIESLRHAGDIGDRSRQIECQWEILGPPEGAVQSSCGLEVTPTSDYLNPNDLDYVFVIGGLLSQLETAPEPHRRFLQAAHFSRARIVGVCTGVFLLAQQRMLAGRTACIHPYHQTDFQTAFPGHRLTTHEDYVMDDKIITVPGGISILSLMTMIIKKHLGSDRSSKTVHQLSLTERRAIGDFEKAGMMRHIEVKDPRIQKALVLIENGTKSGITIPEVANQLGMSERHFSRLFAKQMGMAPKSYVLVTRLRYCLWLLNNSGSSITSIAYAGGFSSCAHFSSAFRAHFGVSPTSIRSRKEQDKMTETQEMGGL